MDHIETAQDGDWNNDATWLGPVPTALDEAIIKHKVTVSQNFTAALVSIKEGGSITTKQNRYVGTAPIRAIVERWRLSRTINDTRTVRLDGVLFEGTRPSIGSEGVGDDLPWTTTLYQDDNRDVIIADPGYIGTQAKLQDMTPEGSGRAYARKVSNSVRYLSTVIRVRSSTPQYLEYLYRLAEGPYQVLLVTDRAIIKGHIETIAPEQSAVGTEYISVHITVAEGL